MSAFDFNTAEQVQSISELIPNGTKAMVVLTIRPGGSGDGGWLKENFEKTVRSLDCEFTIEGGPYDRRKFWTQLAVEAVPNAPITEGQQKNIDISRGKVRGIIESARGITPSDTSEAALNGRKLSSWGDLNGLRFPAKIKVEKGRVNQQTGEKYDDKNALDVAITPGDRDYVHPGQQQAVPAQAPATQAAAGGFQGQAPANNGGVPKPSWAA